MFRQTISYLKSARPNKLVFAAAGMGVCSYATYNQKTFNQPMFNMKAMQFNRLFNSSPVAYAEKHVLVQGQSSVSAVPAKVGR